ncbi:DUF6463 family protein [Pseudactinotalea terrae]|uniref:DUF6463 family protein n=1 Tax=Pseudactinotalea terrae TaxID=1743262 RepID=UPI0013919D5E|nr:DUF6463 family protein [Pseudactinotalea terrae]
MATTITGRPRPRLEKGQRLTAAAGWVAASLGAVHVVVAPWDAREIWSSVAADRWWNAFTLDRATTLAELKRSEAFWVSMGSFGAPMLILGAYLLWSVRQRRRVPAWVGVALLVWGLPFVVVLPASPGWAIPVTGILVVLGDRRERR